MLIVMMVVHKQRYKPRCISQYNTFNFLSCAAGHRNSKSLARKVVTLI